MLKQKETRINQLLGVQASIAQSLAHKFKQSDLRLHVNPKTGSIEFASDVFFGFNSYRLSTKGQDELRQFIPQYIAVLLSRKYRPDISQITVEGFTDKRGTYLYNLNLSQERASAVVDDILAPSFPAFSQKTLLKRYIVAEGRSYNDPVSVNGSYNAAASRRVVFAFQLKNSSIMQAVKGTAKSP